MEGGDRDRDEGCDQAQGDINPERHDAQPLEPAAEGRGGPAGPGPVAPGGQCLRGHGLGGAFRHQPPTCVGQSWVTTFSAAACWAWVGNVSAPDGAGGNSAYAALSTVPLATSVDSRIGRAKPWSHRFWPVVEYRYSSQSLAAAGSGAVALMAWS